METKVCTTCGQEKSIDEFYKREYKGVYKPRSKCIPCYKAINSPKAAEFFRKHPEVREKWRNKNRDRMHETNAAWKKKFHWKVASYSAKRRALQVNQTPENADQEAIQELYKEAARLTKYTGIEHHVDHIQPIILGGLHHEDNLQIIPAVDNLKKGAKAPEEWEKMR